MKWLNVAGLICNLFGAGVIAGGLSWRPERRSTG
jgi:hypothetical protein